MRHYRNTLIVAAALAATNVMAANTITTVTQVSDNVTLSDDVDYVISSDSPFIGSGSVNITNTEHATLIIGKVKPSKVISSWLTGHVFINGAQAVNGVNCQVKMYSSGAIIMPYASDIRPLTVYSEQDFGGTAVNDFGLEHSGGYMNTLSEAKLNNKIRSFKLKRGYMVTFSTRKEGRGYSRCFIADKADLEIKTLPGVLDGTISSYRIFPWYDAQKKGLASDTRARANDALNVSWCYSWGLGENRLPDQECVANHIYEDWPSSSACGSVLYSTHLKTNNEPGNSSDDHPQSVETVLANWENLMRTGMRLCSESSHDGSMSHLDQFIKAIDERGWRCDILDLHCYWPANDFYNWKYWSERYGNRPIWISEWVWGASWNKNGAFADGVTEAQNAEALKPILTSLNESPYVERYAYWNSERDPSRILKNEADLTEAGEYYAHLESGLAYNRQYEKVPVSPKQVDPSDLAAKYDSEQKQVTLTWHDDNGEYNRSMTIQVMPAGKLSWSNLMEVELKEDAANYNISVDGMDGNKYRVLIEDLNGVERTSSVVTAVNENATEGDALTVVKDGETTQMYMGGNQLLNGSFDLGLSGWTSGSGAALTAPYYQAVPKGGPDGGSYLQTYGNSTSMSDNQSMVTYLILDPESSYYAEGTAANTIDGTKQYIGTGITKYSTARRVEFTAADNWTKQGSTFTVGNDTTLKVNLVQTLGKVKATGFKVAKLFNTREEALADARIWAVKRAEAFKTYNTRVPQFNTMLDVVVGNEVSTAADIREAVHTSIVALNSVNAVDSLASNVALMSELALVGASDADKLLASLKAFEQPTPADYLTSLAELKALVATAFSGATAITDGINNPAFASADGWTTKAGTYTSGDQRASEALGKTCWNAWWSLTASGNEDKTMAVKQDVTVATSGLYALEAKAATEHYCEGDQHAFMQKGDTVLASQPLRYGFYDLPNFTDAQKWQTLTTPYVYLSEGTTVTIGFEGSKKGLTDGQYMKYGAPTSSPDNREGWWVATDFALNLIPCLQKDLDASRWGTVSSRYLLAVPDGVEVYQLAGISADSTYIGLTPVSEFKAGYGYVYHATNADVEKQLFTYSGSAAKRTRTVNGLVPCIDYALPYEKGTIVLKDGQWQKVLTDDEMCELYSANITDLSRLPVLADDWTGVTLPTRGIATGIKSVVESNSTLTEGKVYNLRGQRISRNTRGVVISNGRKTVNK